MSPYLVESHLKSQKGGAIGWANNVDKGHKTREALTQHVKRAVRPSEMNKSHQKVNSVKSHQKEMLASKSTEKKMENTKCRRG